MSKTVLHVISGLGDGGAEGALFQLVTSDTRCRHSVISLTTLGKYGPKLAAASIPVFCIGLTKNPLSILKMHRLYRHITCNPVDVVQTWMYHADFFGGIVAWIAGVKKIIWCVRHSTMRLRGSKISTLVIAKLCAWLSHFVPQKIICCAVVAKNVHIDLGYCESKFIVISNGVDADRFCPSSIARAKFRDMLGLSPCQFLIGMVARWNPQKDHRNLIKALGLLLRNGLKISCLLVGPGVTAHNKQLTRLISQFNLQNNVTLLGQISDIPSVMNALDVHVLSSSFGEAFPNVVAEAMCCATPCVVTNVGDASEIVGVEGWVVPPKNEIALADAILEAHSAFKKVEWRVQCDRARDRVVNNFSVESMVESYNQVWDQ